MQLRDKVLSIRFKEFGFCKVINLSYDKNPFPNKINVVKWEHCEPHRVFDLKLDQYVMRDRFCFVIGTLKWNQKELSWDFESCGTRYLEYGTEELNKWILDFCERYEVIDDVLVDKWGDE